MVFSYSYASCMLSLYGVKSTSSSFFFLFKTQQALQETSIRVVRLCLVYSTNLLVSKNSNWGTKSIINNQPISFPKLSNISEKIGSNRTPIAPCTSFRVPSPYISLCRFEGERATLNLLFACFSLIPHASLLPARALV